MISERNRQIAFLAATTSMTNKEIAEKVGCHYNTITRVLKIPEVQALISQVRDGVDAKVVNDLSEAIDRAAVLAFNKLVELMQSATSPAVQFRAVESILDRSSVSPKKVLHSKHEEDRRLVQVRIGADEMKRLSNVMIEAAGGDIRKVPELPDFDENDGYIVEIDRETGEIVE